MPLNYIIMKKIFGLFSRSAGSCGKPAGFSLVEVTIAMGIVSFGLVTLFSLLPVGLNQFREAMNANISSRIAQRLLHEALQTDYSVLVEKTGEEVAEEGGGEGSSPSNKPINKGWRYFDDQGLELEEADKAQAVYHAVTRVVPETTLPALSSPLPNSSLATVTVQVAVNPSNRSIDLISEDENDPLGGMIDPTSGISFTSYMAHIAKSK